MAREFARAFYNSKEWKKVREAVLMRDKYLCRHCGKAAEEVHHIIHLSPDNIGNPAVTMDMGNLISLCKDCHFEEHRGEHGKGREIKEQDEYEFDQNGMLVKKSESTRDISPH
jgi:5-methylcytosine-specific restriction endonuclease McrA